MLCVLPSSECFLTARKMKLRHFRNNQELPWIKNDENYDFEYQQTRPLTDSIVVLPGDHLTTGT